jgi:hypothetical protein
MLVLILGLSVLFLYNRDSPKFWLLVWPGTVLHEGLHWTVGKVLYAKPMSFSVLPNKDDSDIIGSVSFSNLNWFNRVPVCMAPILGLPLAFILFHYVPSFELWSIQGILIVWIFSAMIASSWPSYVDFEVASKNTIGWVFWIGLLVLFLYNKSWQFFG